MNAGLEATDLHVVERAIRHRHRVHPLRFPPGSAEAHVPQAGLDQPRLSRIETGGVELAFAGSPDIVGETVEHDAEEGRALDADPGQIIPAMRLVPLVGTGEFVAQVSAKQCDRNARLHHVQTADGDAVAGRATQPGIIPILLPAQSPDPQVLHQHIVGMRGLDLPSFPQAAHQRQLLIRRIDRPNRAPVHPDPQQRLFRVGDGDASQRTPTGLRHQLNACGGEGLANGEVGGLPVSHPHKVPGLVGGPPVAIRSPDADRAVPARLRPLPFTGDNLDGPVADRRVV